MYLQVDSVTDENELRRMCNESLKLLLECGFTKPPVTVVLLDKLAFTFLIQLKQL